MRSSSCRMPGEWRDTRLEGGLMGPRTRVADEQAVQSEEQPNAAFSSRESAYTQANGKGPWASVSSALMQVSNVMRLPPEQQQQAAESCAAPSDGARQCPCQSPVPG